MPINIHDIPNINQTHNNENKHVICSTDWTKKLNKLYFQWHKLFDQRGTSVEAITKVSCVEFC